MSYIKDVFGRDLPGFDKMFVGFDGHLNRVNKLYDSLAKDVPNYPPYNIRKIDDNKYIVEIAVAGFAKQDIEIELCENKLIIKGSIKDDSDNFLFKGIASRAFTRTFALDDTIEVKNADMLNGMLRIALESIIPESKKPKKIDINDNAQSSHETSSKQYLAE